MYFALALPTSKGKRTVLLKKGMRNDEFRPVAEFYHEESARELLEIINSHIGMQLLRVEAQEDNVVRVKRGTRK